MSERATAAGVASVKILALHGPLGDALDQRALAAAVAARPDAIVVDEASDRGRDAPTAPRKERRASAWRALLAARKEIGAPLVLGSAGGAGVDAMVDEMVELTRDHARENGDALRVAAVRCSQDPETLAAMWLSGRVDPFADGPEIDDAALRRLKDVVALAGAEHIQGALEAGADVVVAGRAALGAAAAAAPLQSGLPPATAWHGAIAAARAGSAALVAFTQDGFEIESADPTVRLTPEEMTIALPATTAPARAMTKPGGGLDLSAAAHHALSPRRVGGAGARWTAAKPYRVELEAAEAAPAALAHTLAMLDPWDACRLDVVDIGPR